MSAQCQKSVVSSIFAIYRASGHCENSEQVDLPSNCFIARLLSAIVCSFRSDSCMVSPCLKKRFVLNSSVSQLPALRYIYWRFSDLELFITHEWSIKTLQFFSVFSNAFVVQSAQRSAHELSPNYMFGMSAKCKHYFRTNRSYQPPPPPDTHVFSCFDANLVM